MKKLKELKLSHVRKERKYQLYLQRCSISTWSSQLTVTSVTSRLGHCSNQNFRMGGEDEGGPTYSPVVDFELKFLKMVYRPRLHFI